MARSDFRGETAFLRDLRADARVALQPRVPSGLGAARGVLVALTVGSGIWAVLAIVVLAVTGRL